MNKIQIYHNSRCSKSRAVFEILEQEKVPFEVVEYLITPPSTSQLDQLLAQLKMSPEQIVRTGEEAFSELKLDSNPPTTRDGWLKLLSENPILIERPIVSNGKSAVLGRPPVRVKEWLQKNLKG